MGDKLNLDVGTLDNPDNHLNCFVGYTSEAGPGGSYHAGIFIGLGHGKESSGVNNPCLQLFAPSDGSGLWYRIRGHLTNTSNLWSDWKKLAVVTT